MPAEPAYSALLHALGDRVDAVAKDLEVYSDDQPPPDYSLANEVQGVLREADARGFDRFHLVGYSGGGGSSLAFAAAHGERDGVHGQDVAEPFAQILKFDHTRFPAFAPVVRGSFARVFPGPGAAGAAVM